MAHRAALALVASLALAAPHAAHADPDDVSTAATNPPAKAEPRASLLGRTASFKALAFDDEAKPLFDGLVHTAEVTDDVEFGMGPEGVQNNLDVVPAVVDVSASRIEISFAPTTQAGWLVAAKFNGYLLAFEPDCLVIDAATIDRGWSTLALDEDDMTFEGRTLKINLSGRFYDRTSRIGIDLSVDDCPMS